MANEITFDKLPQAVGYLTEQVERIHKIVVALQPQTTTDKHRIVEIDEACKITQGEPYYLRTFLSLYLPLKNNTDTEQQFDRRNRSIIIRVLIHC